MSLNTNTTEPQARAAPYNSDTYNRGSQGAESNNEALIIRRLEQEEKEMNTFLISAGGFSFSTIWLIVHSILDLQEKTAHKTAHHLAEIFSYVSQGNSPPVAVPDTALTPSGSSLIRAIVYWFTGLFFGLSAIFVAIMVKGKIRDHRVALQSHSQPWEKVSLVVLILGHVNFFLFPVGTMIFVPTVIFGWNYVFGPLQRP
ncbi:hypothetical protein EI94DRAFT_1795489 [Lactarius quietus]|nr:hypothetical protein EI94DRAFT_1795489 [Lactarius quietus]